MNHSKTFYSSIVLMAFLLLTTLSQSINIANLAWNVAFTVQGSSFQVGSFAEYTPSNLSLQYLVGYAQASGPAASNEMQALNKTTFDYLLQSMSWRIDGLVSGYFDVNYSIELKSSNAGGSTNSTVLSDEVLVSERNASLYTAEGTYIGQWPYWLPSSLGVGQNATFLHEYPLYACNYAGSCGVSSITPVEFLSLPLGSRLPTSPGNSSTFVDTSLSLPSIGGFKTDRLVVSYPYLIVSHCNTVADCEAGLFNSSGPVVIEGIPTPNWVAAYDQSSGMMLALQHDDWFVDDVMLHSELRIWHIGFELPSLVLSSTNIGMTPDSQASTGTPPTFLIVAAGLVVATSFVSVAYLWRKRNLAIKSAYSMGRIKPQ